MVTAPSRLADRDRELAAGEEAGGFTRKRGQVRLGERRHEAVVLQQVERAEQVGAEDMAEQAQRRSADDVVEGRPGDRRRRYARDRIGGALGRC